tara:strand:- start:3885 stop:5642 length:1758 start_codon:yes stop_codon:yes gene_type:complete
MSFLLNLKTDLKSLKYSKDRPEAGYSGQPFIQKEIPTSPSNFLGENDFLVRGGVQLPRIVVDDLERLGRYFIDTKSPKGLLFIAKQNLLSRTAVKTQASSTFLNEGVYTPLSTLAQAGVSAIGFHLNKQGINPLKGVRTYSDVAQEVIGEETGDINRLVLLRTTKIAGKNSYKFSDQPKLSKSTGINFKNPLEILEYSGGPTSPIPGVGKTRIPFALGNTGAPLRTSQGEKILGIGFPNDKNFTTTPSSLIFDLSNSTESVGNNFLVDFRKLLLENVLGDTKNLDNNNPKNSSTIMGIAPSYNPTNQKTLDNATGTSRVNYTSPGARGNILNYSLGKRGTDGKVVTVDKINAYPIYDSTSPKLEPETNDLIDFMVGVINPYKKKDGEFVKEWLHFRAYIDSFSDAYNGSWGSTQYMGRPEEVFNYKGFKRKINLSFTVAAQSKPELIKQYKKLNFLASTLAPTISEKGYMSGTLVNLTMGGWCADLTGFIDSLTLGVPQESPWEIGIDTNGDKDPTTSQLPHIVKVEGFSFTPIHNFVPQKARINDDGNTFDRFISMQSSNREDSSTNNLWEYDKDDKSILNIKQ